MTERHLPLYHPSLCPTVFAWPECNGFYEVTIEVNGRIVATELMADDATPEEARAVLANLRSTWLRKC